MTDGKIVAIGAGVIIGLATIIYLATRAKAAPPEPPVPDAANLYGTVTDAETGQPLSGVAVSIDTLSTSTGTDGRYAFVGLDSGSYTIRFEKAGYDYLQQEVILEPGDSILDVELAPVPPTLANLSGRVTDALTGDPLPGVVISINTLSTSTGADGKYVFTDLDPGGYTIIFSKAGYETLETTVTLVEGDYVLDVALAPEAAPGRRSPCPPIGDLDGDGYITQNDLTLLYHVVGRYPNITDEELLRADVNGDGVVNAFDITTMELFLEGQIDTFPACGFPPGPI